MPIVSGNTPASKSLIGVAGTAPYHAFNFSPSGQWAAYAFSGYRQRDAVGSRRLASIGSPHIVLRRFADRLELDAIISRDALPSSAATGALQLALSAVVEAADGRCSLGAATTARPIFSATTLELAAPTPFEKS
jgi:hypothetical protein